MPSAAPHHTPSRSLGQHAWASQRLGRNCEEEMHLSPLLERATPRERDGRVLHVQ